MYQEQREKTETMEKAVFLTLRKAILAGYLFPGEKLLESDLSEKIGISRTPIRAAILRLEKEQLVVTTPQKGATVIRLSSAQVEEGYILTGVLQGFATYLAFPHLNEQLVSEMEAIDLEMKSEQVLDRYAEWLRKNRAFHDILVSNSGNSTLIYMIRNNAGRLTRYWYLACSLGLLKTSNLYHSRIIEEIKNGNAERLRSIVEEHFSQTGRDIRAYLDRTGRAVRSTLA